MDGGKRINLPLLRPVTVKVLAEISVNKDFTFRFGKVMEERDRYALTALQDGKKINLVIDGQTAIQFAEEIKKGVINS